MSATADADDIRLNRFLALVGIASRRACDDIIAAGRVVVNGERVTTPGTRVQPGDTITLDGTALSRPARPLVLLLNKPPATVSTVSDPEGRTTVIDLCGKYRKGRRLFPVGRLDYNTTGALLITNDGMLCYRLTHPRYGIARTYQVRVRGSVTESTLRRMRRMAGEEETRERRRGPRPSVSVVKQLGRETLIRVTLLEGRNRQVRKMCEAVGLRVVRLKRLSFGPVSVRGIPEGAVRPLDRGEYEKLLRAVEH